MNTAHSTPDTVPVDPALLAMPASQPTAGTAGAAADYPRTGPIAAWNRIADGLTGLTPHTLLALATRFGIASIFWFSGRTKVDGWLTVNESAYELFRSEYKVPLLPPELAAHLATYAEHAFPILLALGLLTRLSALGLLGMTLTIQLFVYPDAWSTHLSWAALLLYLVGRGAGSLSLDHLLRIK